MFKAFVIGNGSSRLKIDLPKLKEKTYGCNALYRDFTPNTLISVDEPITKEIENSGYPLKNEFYTNYPNFELGSKRLPKYCDIKSAGICAMSMAATSGYSDVYLIGFDNLNVDYMDNIYTNTKWYQKEKKIVSKAESFCYFVKEKLSLFNRTKFINVSSYNVLSPLCSVKNFHQISINEFINSET